MVVMSLIILVVVVLVISYDLLQRKHAIIRNFPIIGHLRYFLEAVGPELRQYIVTSNDEEMPFSRDQRSWVYASSKDENNYFGFGSDNNMELRSNYLIFKHAAFPILDPRPGEPGYDSEHRVPCAKILGAHRGRAKSFRPDSIVNVSAMSYGSLSSSAVRAINEGSKLAGCWQNTGEGSVSEHHLQGGDLLWQIGTGYFGCRDEKGHFSMDRFLEMVERHSSIRGIELKLSQGGKAGVGGMLPGAKVSAEIARVRSIPQGKHCMSPPYHSAFHDVDSMLDFVESLADATGLPVGIKSAVGEGEFWEELAQQMSSSGRGVDFITIDGGEGGSGASPLAFSDHVSLPFKLAFTRVYRLMAEHDLAKNIVFIGAGRLGFPEQANLAVALGCDIVAVAREAMLSIGCIQAQRCHTGRCPTGVATQNAWLVRGLDPSLKSVRLCSYVRTLRREMLSISRACGAAHPSLLNLDSIEMLDDRFGSRSVRELFRYPDRLSSPSEKDRAAIADIQASIGT